LELSLDDLGEATHGALLEAVAASNACLFVDYFADTVHDFQNALGASVDADTAADALFRFDYRMRHSNSFFLFSSLILNVLVVQNTTEHDKCKVFSAIFPRRVGRREMH
jgi:hypothetical protein